MSFKPTKNQTITIEMLQKLDACQNQIVLFQKTFGDSVELTQKSIDKTIDVGLDVVWAFTELNLTGHFVDKIGNKFWYKNGKLHNKNGYAVKLKNGDKEWWINGKLHRADGPACEFACGDKEWFVNDKPHREDGPAIFHLNGTKHWYINGELHREDGPAREWENGDKEWWENGKFIKEIKNTYVLQTSNVI